MKAAFFDLDNTLTHGDTLPLWLAVLRGWPRTLCGYAVAIAFGWAVPAAAALDTRGRIKTLLLRLTISGLSAAQVAEAGAVVQQRIKWREDVLAKLRQHNADGHRVIVVTGAATIYLPALLKDLPVDEILGTQLEERDGVLTGSIAGVNCVRAAKAVIVRDWLARHQPAETWGYGNAPHDLEMLALLTHQTVV